MSSKSIENFNGEFDFLVLWNVVTLCSSYTEYNVIYNFLIFYDYNIE